MTRNFNSSHPLVSVLLPVYNGERFIRDSIQSVLDQTLTNFELIIVDDGSNDGTFEIINSFEDPRIKIIRNITNQGISKSLNLGLKLSQGEYIARHDADDLAHSERLKKQIKYFNRNPFIGVVGTWTKVVDEFNNEIDIWKLPTKPEDVFFNLMFHNCLTHSSVCFRKEIVIKAGGYRKIDKDVEDYSLWLRCLKLTKIANIPEFLTVYRVRDDSISRTSASQIEKTSTLSSNFIFDLLGLRINHVVVDAIRINRFTYSLGLKPYLNYRKICKALLKIQLIKENDYSVGNLNEAMRIKGQKLINAYPFLCRFPLKQFNKILLK